jgi:hypothetical protein
LTELGGMGGPGRDRAATGRRKVYSAFLPAWSASWPPPRSWRLPGPPLPTTIRSGLGHVEAAAVQVELVDPVSRVRDEELADGAEREPSKLTASPVRWRGRSPDEVRDRHHSISVRPARTSPQLGACHPPTGRELQTPCCRDSDRMAHLGRAVVPGGAFAASATQSREARIPGISGGPSLLGLRMKARSREARPCRGHHLSLVGCGFSCSRTGGLPMRRCAVARQDDAAAVGIRHGRPATVTRPARRCWHLPCCRCGPSSSKQRASDLARQVEALARW